MNILWHSVSPFSPSGYGIVTKNVPFRFHPHFPILVSAYHGLIDSTVTINNIKLVSATSQTFGKEYVNEFIKYYKIDLPILCSDFWAFKWFSKLENSTCYGPIDCADYIDEDIETLRDYDNFITCSQYGANVYKELTGKNPLKCIPHGVDTTVYQPYNKEVCKKALGFNKPFVFGIVAANNDPEPRKGWDIMLSALKEFKELFPNDKDKWMVYAHTDQYNSRGINLTDLARKLGLEKNIVFSDFLSRNIGLDDKQMACLYSSFDVLINASRREGFCLPVLEAQACGTPVIATDCTSLTELVKGHGYLVNKGKSVYNARGWLSTVPDQQRLVKQLEVCYFDNSMRDNYGKQAHEFSLSYDWRRIVNEEWLPLLEHLSKLKINIISSNDTKDEVGEIFE